MLGYDLACARARDAVITPLDIGKLVEDLEPHASVPVKSAAGSRGVYLRHPDMGRLLAADSAEHLKPTAPDLVIILGDGLSSQAVQRHGPPMVAAILERAQSFVVAPVIIAEQARVALADDIGERLMARASVILIGERPGLSTNDSLGIYMTYAPKVGRTDAEKNCISNIHDNGLSYAAAADQLIALLTKAFARGFSGVGLANSDDLIAPEEGGILPHADGAPDTSHRE